MKIPLLDLKAQYRRIGKEVRKAIDEVLQSQQFILGSTVQRFEEAAASYLGGREAIGVASGSDALLLSLMALEVGPGDAVLVPAFTFFSSASAITRLGAMPIFVDIDPATFLLDPAKVETLFEQRCWHDPSGVGFIDRMSGRHIKALLPVHLFGQCCPMPALLCLAAKCQLRIVEDVAQAFGARAPLSGGASKAAGTMGDLGCFSFYPSKNLGAYGDGGLVVTNDNRLAEKIRTLRDHGQSSSYHHDFVGLNSRLDAIQAAVLAVKLKYIEEWRDERLERARLYLELFSETGLTQDGTISLPATGDGRSHVFNYYVIRAKQRDELRRYLDKHGIDTEVYYPLPLHLQPCFSQFGCRPGDFPNSELAAQQALALPMCPELTKKHQETVVKKINDFYRK